MASRPSFGDKVNGIVRFIEDPCDAPFLLYVELAREPFKKALLTFFSFGLSDIMRGYFRPKGIRSRRHGRGGRKGGRGASRVGRAIGRVPGLGDDLGNFIGKNMIGGETLSQRHVTQGVKNLWIVDGLLQRALFYWLIIGITTDFLYEWSSLLQESAFCSRSGQFGLYAEGDGGGFLAIQGWKGVIGMIETRNHGRANWSGSAVTLEAGRWTIIFALSLRQIGIPGSSTHEARLIDVFGGGVLAQSAGVTVGVGEVSEMIVTLDVQGPITVAPQARISFGGALGAGADFWVSGD